MSEERLDRMIPGTVDYAEERADRLERQRDVLLEALRECADVPVDDFAAFTRARKRARAAIASVEKPTTHRTD